MTTVRVSGVAYVLLAFLLFLGGCSSNPWGPPPTAPEPANLIANGDAENNGAGWIFGSTDASVRFEGGNPTFAIRNDASIRQRVDIRGIPGQYAVLMAMTAAETIGATGVGTIHGAFLGAGEPPALLGYLESNDLVSTVPMPIATFILADYVLIPSGTEQIDVFLENTEVTGVPHDGSLTWFDDVELWIVETVQDAQDVIQGYKAARQP